MDRREFALGAGVLFAGAAMGSSAFAYDGAVSLRARSLYRRATVVDANLGPPLTSDQLPLPQETLDLARNAGVSAIKTSMGGFNAPFEDTLVEIAFYQRLIEAHPDYFRQIRSVADIAPLSASGSSASSSRSKARRVSKTRSIASISSAISACA